MKEKLFRAKHSIGLALRIILAVAVITLIAINFTKLQNLDVRALIENSSTFAATVATILGVYLLKGLTLVVPASLVYIAVGMAIKPLIAVLLNCIGIVIEVSATYLMGIILGGPFVMKKLEQTKYGNKILSMYEKHEKSGVFLIRIAGLPIDFCSLFFGAMRVRYVPYLLMSLAGILPRVIVLTILGDKVYNLIPMKYVIPVAAGLIVVALIVWIVKYLSKSTKQEMNFGKPAYTPICESGRSVILDTDIGPDCDDTGALAILLRYIKKYNVKLLGIANCTSNPYGNGAARAICDYYGFEDIPAGRFSGTMLPNGLKYNKEVTKKYCKYESSACGAMDEKEFYKKVLKDAEDDSVTVITIGTFSNISSVLNDDPDLFNRKVHSIVAMAAEYPKGKEFNVVCDPLSAANVVEKFKKMIIFSGYEVGKSIRTGFFSEKENNPVYDSYRLYTGNKSLPYTNSSWDLIAVQYAFEGNSTFYTLTEPLDLKITMDGSNEFKKNKFGKFYCMVKKASDEDIAAYLNAMLIEEPNTADTGDSQ